MTDVSSSALARITAHVVGELAHGLGLAPDRIDPERPFVDLGADSLILAETLQDINRRYRVALSIGEIYESVNTVARVAAHLYQHGRWQAVLDARPGAASAVATTPAAFAAEDAPALAAPLVADTSGIEALFRRQLDLMEQQLALLGGGAPARAPTMPERGPAAVAPPAPTSAAASFPAARESGPLHASAEAAATAAPSIPASAADDRFSAFAPRLEADRRGDDARTRAHLDAFVACQDARLSASKALAQAYRSPLSDNRVSAGFRPLLKELVYPVAAIRAEGAHVVDIDGNRYVDFTMGFGVHLFGHGPAFIADALRAQLDVGMPVGPQSPLAGRVAEWITRFTGHERVVFCNSGTEATMTAIRLARLASGRDKLVIFRNSYHGSFDGVLARRGAHGETRPASLGTPDSFVADTIVLDYCDDASLDYLDAHHAEIGVVLVEPVQSRAPSLRPGAFLKRLRALTQARGIVLVFDEVISGFRCARGGAQEYFGVRADLCAYGKIVGGGMPIGVVAGSARCMDGIDGGWWRYGDDSYPERPTIFFAGTFSKHPLTMAAALAVLERFAQLEQTDPEFHARLNARTESLAERLNAAFAEAGAAIAVEHFSSLFRFASEGSLDLFYHHLLAHGIYIWEGRNCFVSAAHTDADLDQLVETVRAVCAALAPLSLIPLAAKPDAAAPAAVPDSVPLTDAQQRFLALERSRPEGRIANHICFAFRFDAAIDVVRLAAAVDETLRAHDALACRIDVDAGVQRFGGAPPRPTERVEHAEPLTPERAAALADHEQAEPLDVDAGDNLRARVHVFPDGALLCVSVHHLVCDGWGLDVLLAGFAQRFNGEPVEPAPSYAEWIAHERDYRASDRYAADRAYWAGTIREIAAYQARHPPGAVHHPRDAAARPGGRASVALDAARSVAVAAAAKQAGTTTFTWLLACLQWFVGRVYRGRLPVVGMPFANRTSRLRGLAGNCVNLPPLLPARGEGAGFDAVLREARAAFSQVMSHARFPHHELRALYLAEGAPERDTPVDITFNVEPLAQLPAFGATTPALVVPVNRWIEFDLMFNLFLLPDGLRIELDFNTALFAADEVYGWLNLFAKLIENESAHAAELAP
jgi:glutamate-1-semialdehyde aminotransferase/acyl carrier protein